MKLSIITCIYNPWEIAKRTLESVRLNTTLEYEHILVFNHPPIYGDELWRELVECTIEDRGRDRVIVLDPGQNLGCHDGFNRGAGVARGDVLVKLDDDTAVPPDWDTKMMLTLANGVASLPSLVLVSADLGPKQNIPYDDIEVGPYTVQIPHTAGQTIGFSCAMFPRTLYEEIGPMKPLFRLRTPEYPQDSVYGGEEAYYCAEMAKRGYRYGHIKDVFVEHAAVEGREDYQAWKFYYGYCGDNRKFDELVAEGALSDAYYAWEMHNYEREHNDVLHLVCLKRMKELGYKNVRAMAKLVREQSENGEVILLCDEILGE